MLSFLHEPWYMGMMITIATILLIRLLIQVPHEIEYWKKKRKEKKEKENEPK